MARDTITCDTAVGRYHTAGKADLLVYIFGKTDRKDLRSTNRSHRDGSAVKSVNVCCSMAQMPPLQTSMATSRPTMSEEILNVSQSLKNT